MLGLSFAFSIVSKPHCRSNTMSKFFQLKWQFLQGGLAENKATGKPMKMKTPLLINAPLLRTEMDFPKSEELSFKFSTKFLMLRNTDKVTNS